MDIEDHVQDLAKQLVGNWKKFESFGWHDRPDDCDDWCIVYIQNRDSGLCDLSNAHVIQESLSVFLKKEDGDIQKEHHGHWAFGWVDGYVIRVYKPGTKEVTEAFRAYAVLKLRIDDYPLLDEDDHSRREYEAALEAISSNGRLFVKKEAEAFVTESWAVEVFSWLYENDQSELENREDQGACPSDDAIKKALKALDMLAPDYEEDIE